MTAELCMFFFSIIWTSSTSARGSFGVVYNSGSALQQKLHLAASKGFRDSGPDYDYDGPPYVHDLRSSTPEDVAARILSNHKTRTRLVSLLDRKELLLVLEACKRLIIARVETEVNPKNFSLIFVLPRECIDLHTYVVPSAGPLFRVECLQMDARGAAMALLHRVARVGITKLIPVTMKTGGSEAEAIYRVYKETASHLTDKGRAPFKFARIQSLRELQSELKFSAESQAEGNSSSSSKEVLGVLVLDREQEALARIMQTVSAASTTSPARLLYRFTPWGTQGMISAGVQNPIYTVVYAGTPCDGAREKASSSRRRLLTELVGILGAGDSADPLLLTAILAYDAATRAVHPFRSELLSGPFHPEPLSLVSATRARSDGVFYGLSPKPTLELTASRSALLQRSDFIVEDVLKIAVSKGGVLKIVDYKAPTATVISASDLTALVNTAEGKIRCKPGAHEARITTWDPISETPATYEYGLGHSEAGQIPEYLLIPNQHGYAMELSCEHKESEAEGGSPLVSSVSIACTPAGIGVNCFRSGFRSRARVRRDASAAYAGAMPTSTEAPTTTTTAPPAPPPPPLPDLRAILRAAKPFIGGCVGTQLGCAVCVIFLTQAFPILGTQPAICAGPCFTNTFSQCGAILGRVGSETTVICTELFRQGRIDALTFLADAEFGWRMQQEAPYTLMGYRLLATPFVRAMRDSEWVTDVVALFAEPWARYMKGLVKGEPDPSNWAGAWIHSTGAPLCEVVGRVAAWVIEGAPLHGPFCPSTALQWAALLACLALLWLFMRKKTHAHDE